MTAGKHHAELVVLDFLFKDWRFRGQILPNPQKVDEFRGEAAEMIVPPKEINGPVAGHPHEPGRGIVGKAVNRPHFQGGKVYPGPRPRPGRGGPTRKSW